MSAASPSLRIAMAQVNTWVGDIARNTESVIRFAEQARDDSQAQAILFPELTLSGYPPEDLLYREGFMDRIEQAVDQIKATVHGIHLIIGLPLRTGDGIANAALVIRDGQIVGRYLKQRLPNYSVFDEKRYFVAGTAPLLFELAGTAVGVTVCEDIWDAGPAAQAAAAGAKVMLNLNASPFHLGKAEEREAVLRQRVNETGLPILYTNLVGGQDELVFDGDSFAMDGQGKVVCRAPAFEEALSVVELSIADGAIIDLRGAMAPALSEEASAYQALVLGTRDYVQKNGFPGAVIGMSGGIDSALTVAVAVDALGADNVAGVSMPSRYTADMSKDDAKEEAKLLGIDFSVIPIEPIFNAFTESLAESFAGTQADITEENIQARARGVLLMAISNKKGRIVLTTGNKSEMAVGYATLYGDMAGGYAVLKDVPKTLVYRLSNYRNSLGRVIPERVITRPPSAELAPDQKDSDSLPDYDVLDPVLEMFVEQEMCPSAIIARGYDAAMVERVVKMVERNEYKRRQAAPGPRVTRRAFGRDRRYPITSGYGRNRP